MAKGQAIHQAMADARDFAQANYSGNPSWTLAVVYSTAAMQGRVHDTTRQDGSVAMPSLVQHSLQGMTKGHTDRFVGRRREQQRLLPGLRRGCVPRGRPRPT